MIQPLHLRPTPRPALRHKTCQIVRGVKRITCIHCNTPATNYSNGANICADCSNKLNLCIICGATLSN